MSLARTLPGPMASVSLGSPKRAKGLIGLLESSRVGLMSSDVKDDSLAMLFLDERRR